MIKVAIVGVGGISGAHIPVWEKIKDVEVVGICDIRQERLDLYPHLNHYLDIDEMLEKEQIDILDICLPTYLHPEVSIKAMEKGINVICEKPISLNKDDVKKIYDTAKKNNVKFMVAQVLRFWPEYKLLKEIFDEKKYGKLLSGYMCRLSQMPKWSWDNWMFDEKRSGLVPFDLHIHDSDFMVYAFGSPNNIIAHRSKRKEQDYISAVYEYDDYSIIIESSWYAAPYPFKAHFRFQFENAVVVKEENGLIIYDKDNGVISSSTVNNDKEGGVINLPTTNAYANEIEYFLDCVVNNKEIEIIKSEQLEKVLELLENF